MSHRIVSNRPMHIHPHLEIIKRGREVPVPANVGIKPSLYKNHSLDAFIGDMGAAPVHTHDSSGILHVESSVTINYTLGDFYSIWGKQLPANAHVTANGHAVKRPENLVLKDGQQIVVEIP